MNHVLEGWIAFIAWFTYKGSYHKHPKSFHCLAKSPMQFQSCDVASPDPETRKDEEESCVSAGKGVNTVFDPLYELDSADAPRTTLHRALSPVDGKVGSRVLCPANACASDNLNQAEFTWLLPYESCMVGQQCDLYTFWN